MVFGYFFFTLVTLYVNEMFYLNKHHTYRNCGCDKAEKYSDLAKANTFCRIANVNSNLWSCEITGNVITQCQKFFGLAPFCCLVPCQLPGETHCLAKCVNKKMKMIRLFAICDTFK